MSKKKSAPKKWKSHKQVLVELNCGVSCKVDKGIANFIRFLNASGVQTRHSCQGGIDGRGYVSMFATPRALGLAHYLLDHSGVIDLVIERSIHPYGYENLVFRWPAKNQKSFEILVRKYYSC